MSGDALKPIKAKIAQLIKEKLDLQAKIRQVDTDVITLTRAMRILGLDDIETQDVPVPVPSTRIQIGQYFDKNEFPNLILEVLRDATEPMSATAIGDAVLKKRSDIPSTVNGAKLNGRISTILTTYAKRALSNEIIHQRVVQSGKSIGSDKPKTV